MKKDHIRDYATEAFRFYKNKIKCEMDLIQLRAEFIASEEGEKNIAEYIDILSVDRTINQLNKHERQAVDIVYFTDADKPIKKGDIDNRVIKASLMIPCGKTTVYNYLKKARITFAKERGLRL